MTDWVVTINAMQGSKRGPKVDGSKDKPVGKVRKQECKKGRRKDGKRLVKTLTISIALVNYLLLGCQ